MKMVMTLVSQSAIRAEFDMQKQELIASFNREKQEMLDSFALKLAAKENEIAMLRGRKQDDVNEFSCHFKSSKRFCPSGRRQEMPDSW